MKKSKRPVIFAGNGVRISGAHKETMSDGLNRGGGGINVNASNFTLQNATISNNSSFGRGGGIFLHNSNATLTHVSIINNISEHSGGGGVGMQDGFNSLTNVSINGNTSEYGGGGIYLDNSNPILTNVSISENITSRDGGGMEVRYGSYPILTNVTISGNNANDDGGGILLDNSHLILSNSIIWDNSPNPIYFREWIDPYNPDDSTLITIMHSDIQGGEEGIMTNANGVVYWESGNIDSDPLFIGNTNYHLQEGSPCIDAGTALFVWKGDTLINMSETDYIGLAPDMGAYEYGALSIGSGSKVVPKSFKLHQNFPNPFNPITTLRYDLPSNALVTLSIYDMLGREIIQLVSDNQQAGFKSIQWDATDSMGRPVSAGVYLYQINAGEFVQTKKMVLLK